VAAHLDQMKVEGRQTMPSRKWRRYLKRMRRKALRRAAKNQDAQPENRYRGWTD